MTLRYPTSSPHAPSTALRPRQTNPPIPSHPIPSTLSPPPPGIPTHPCQLLHPTHVHSCAPPPPLPTACSSCSRVSSTASILCTAPQPAMAASQWRAGSSRPTLPCSAAVASWWALSSSCQRSSTGAQPRRSRSQLGSSSAAASFSCSRACLCCSGLGHPARPVCPYRPTRQLSRPWAAHLLQVGRVKRDPPPL